MERPSDGERVHSKEVCNGCLLIFHTPDAVTLGRALSSIYTAPPVYPLVPALRAQHMPHSRKDADKLEAGGHYQFPARSPGAELHSLTPPQFLHRPFNVTGLPPRAVGRVGGVTLQLPSPLHQPLRDVRATG